MGKKRTPESVKNAVIARLADKYTLAYVEYDDGLTDEQIAVLLKGENPYESSAFSDWDEWDSDNRYDGAITVIKDVCEDDEYDILEEDSEALDEVRFAVQDRDDSDTITALLDNTNHKLFRYDLDYELEPDSWNWSVEETDTAAREMADACRLPHTDKILSAMRDIIVEASYGGNFYVIWYGSPKEAVDLASAIDGTHDKSNPGTVTFSRPRLLVLDRMNGSGMDGGVDVDITLPIVPGNVTLDDEDFGYSWTQTAGPYNPAYACDLTIKRDPEELDGRWAVNDEYIGVLGKRWVARFCGGWLGKADTRDGAIAIAVEHARKFKAAVKGEPTD